MGSFEAAVRGNEVGAGFGADFGADLVADLGAGFGADFGAGFAVDFGAGFAVDFGGDFEAGFTVGSIEGCFGVGLGAGCGTSGGAGCGAGVGVGKMTEGDPEAKFISGVLGSEKRKAVFCCTEDLTVEAVELGEGG